MSPKDLIVFIYGFFMGTSTGYLKTSRDFEFPISEKWFGDSFFIQLGGTCNCGLLLLEDAAIVMNTGSGDGAAVLRETVNRILSEKFSTGLGKGDRILLTTSDLPDDVGGIDYFRNFRKFKTVDESRFRDHIKVIRLRKSSVFKMDDRKVLMAGRLFYNSVHPPLGLENLSLKEWITSLDEILQIDGVEYFVPAEGKIASRHEVNQFKIYLSHLENSQISLSQLKDEFGSWQEIIGSSSLTENFETARGIVVR